MKKFLRELVTSNAENGKVSHTRFWSNIGMLAMTSVFCWGGFHNTLTWDIYLIYAVTVTQPALLSKYISLKFLAPQTIPVQAPVTHSMTATTSSVVQTTSTPIMTAIAPVATPQPINSPITELHTGVPN